MKSVPGVLAAYDGQILDNDKITFRIPNGVAYDGIFLDTNIPKEAFKRIVVANGRDERIKTSGPEIIDLREKMWGRDVDLTKHPLPIRFNPSDAMTTLAADAYPLITTPSDSWMLEIEFGTLGTVPTGGFYCRPKTMTQSLLVPLKGGGFGTRKEVFRQRIKSHSFTAVQGENVFDKTPTGVNLAYQAIHIKGGDVKHVEFEGYVGGQRSYNWELDKPFNDYLIETRGQRMNAQAVDGYFTIFPTASGYLLSDMDGLNFDRVDLILDVETAGQIEIIFDLIEVM